MEKWSNSQIEMLMKNTISFAALANYQEKNQQCGLPGNIRPQISFLLVCNKWMNFRHACGYGW
jgi:hypothetical protein